MASLFLFLALPCSVTSMFPPPPPSPMNAPAFSSTGSLTRPSDAQPLPSEPVLASDEGSIRSYVNASNDASSKSSESVGHSTDTTAGEWDGIKKLFQRALPFLAIGMALLCSCGLCCCCYCAWRRANRPAHPPYYGGPPPPQPQFMFAAGGGYELGGQAYPPGYPQQWPGRDYDRGPPVQAVEVHQSSYKQNRPHAISVPHDGHYAC